MLPKTNQTCKQLILVQPSGYSVWLLRIRVINCSFVQLKENIYKRVIESDRAQASSAEQRHRLTKQKRARSEQERWQRLDVSQYKSKTTRCWSTVSADDSRHPSERWWRNEERFTSRRFAESDWHAPATTKEQQSLHTPHAKWGSVLALSVTFSFFVCASNISGTAERICAKFTGWCNR